VASNPGRNASQPSKEPESFPTLLRYYRKRANQTQLQLKHRLDDFGFTVEVHTISMWETGKRSPSDSAAFHYIGRCLGLTEEEEKALVNACLMDFSLAYLENYWRAKGGTCE
jgi:transcriptional regulator with XRE-family HTH domain